MISTERKRCFPYCICSNFFRTVLFLEKILPHIFSEYLLRHNSFFIGVAISSEQLLFLRSSSSRTVASLRQLFFSEQLLFHIKSSTEQPGLENSQFFRIVTLSEQLFFLMKELVQNKHIYRTATFLKRVFLHSSNFFRTDTFSTKVLFQKRDFFKWRYNT